MSYKLKNMSTNEKLIIDYLKNHKDVSSKQIHEDVMSLNSYATTKRILQRLIDQHYILSSGKSKATKYNISPAYELIAPQSMHHYFEKEIDERTIIEQFNFKLIHEILPHVNLFDKTEEAKLNELQETYRQNSAQLSTAAYNKELERLAIDLSWKSSQIEGNTYSLLETEKLLKDKETASGKTKDEATMLLNHKDALDFIIAHPDYVNPITVACIEDIHYLLAKELNIDKNIRTSRVGISGTNYRPLDNTFQLKEALEAMCLLINTKESVFEKSLLALVLISYIQPYADGNKRTARIISNALLMHHHYCPISFRTVDSVDYKMALLLFYEQNNISAFKKMYIQQFEFAVNTYF